MKNLKIVVFTTLAMLCLNFGAKAQQKQLRVGDRLPASFWTQEYNILQDGKYTKQALASYKDQLLILDFWATWCGSCIVKFPAMEALQSLYPDSLKVLLVNPTSYKDKKEIIEELFNGKRPPRYRKCTLPTVVADTNLVQLFEPVQLPQHIWIIDGYVRAITASEFTTTQGIDQVFKNSDSTRAKMLKITGGKRKY